MVTCNCAMKTTNNSRMKLINLQFRSRIFTSVSSNGRNRCKDDHQYIIDASFCWVKYYEGEVNEERKL